MEAGRDQRAFFEVQGGAPADAEADLLGLWIVAPASPAGAVAFDLTGPATPEPPVWRATLPADPKLTEANLKSAEDQLRASRAALSVAGDRLDAFVQAQTAPAFDFSTAAAQLAEPERELLWLLGEIEGRPPAESFALGDRPRATWAEVNDQFRAFVDRLVQLVAHYAWVETHQAERILGRTTVSWTGDVDTFWPPALEPAQAALHQRTLALALASRDALIRVFTLVTAGAVKLSVLLSTPGGALLALPAAWKFINQVLDEIERHQQTTQKCGKMSRGRLPSGERF